MKKFIIIILILSLLIVFGCTKIIPLGTVSITAETPQTVIKTITNTVTVEDTAKITELQNEVTKYQSLIGNLNGLLKNVYYAYEKKSDGSSSWGTGFSLKYNNKYYLITAGHIVNGEYGYFPNLGFETNNNWIYPKLLKYNNDYNNRNDYAIFYSDKIKDGLTVDNENDNPEYVLGYDSLNTIKDFNNSNIVGESGSPIIDNEGEVVGIDTTDIPSYFTEINKVTQAMGKY